MMRRGSKTSKVSKPKPSSSTKKRIFSMTQEEIDAAQTPKIRKRAETSDEMEAGEVENQDETNEPSVAELIASLQKKGVKINIPDDFDEQDPNSQDDSSSESLDSENEMEELMNPTQVQKIDTSETLYLEAADMSDQDKIKRVQLQFQNYDNAGIVYDRKAHIRPDAKDVARLFTMTEVNNPYPGRTYDQLMKLNNNEFFESLLRYANAYSSSSSDPASQIKSCLQEPRFKYSLEKSSIINPELTMMLREKYASLFCFHLPENAEHYSKLLAIYKLINEQMFKKPYEGKLYELVQAKLLQHQTAANALDMMEFISFLQNKHLQLRDHKQKLEDCGFEVIPKKRGGVQIFH